MLTLVVGGGASGKSEIAESISMHPGHRLYIATMKPFDDECHHKIMRHREMRAKKGFETAEVYGPLCEATLPPSDSILLECLSNLLANELYSDNKRSENPVDLIFTDLSALANNTSSLTIVSNEIFSDANDYSDETLFYIKCLGVLNMKLAEIADVVIEASCGKAVFHKGNLNKINYFEGANKK